LFLNQNITGSWLTYRNISEREKDGAQESDSKRIAVVEEYRH
jgi:hypothetical protein